MVLSSHKTTTIAVCFLLFLVKYNRHFYHALNSRNYLYEQENDVYGQAILEPSNVEKKLDQWDLIVGDIASEILKSNTYSKYCAEHLQRILQ